MKKIIAALLTLIMATALFAGCGQDNGDVDLPVNVGDTTPKPQESTDPGQSQTAGAALTRAPLGGTGMIAAGSIHNVGLRTNGTIVSGGHDQYGQRRTSNWTDIVFVAANKSATIGVKADGSALFAGEMTGSEAVSGWSNVYMVAMGGDFAVALLNDGTVTGTSGAPDVSAWSDMVWVAAGESFAIGLKSDGTVAATTGAPDVSAWTNMVKIAAGADRAAGITAEGKLVASISTAAFDANSDYVAVDVGAAGLVAVRADGSVVAAMEVEADNDPLVYADSKDITAVKNAVSVAVGDTHAVVMDRTGYAYAYGKNTDLQCDVGTFNLRPYVENVNGANYIRGIEIGSTVEQAKKLIALFTGADSVAITKADGSEAADTDTVATGMKAGDVGEIVIMGDGNGDGAVTEEDSALIDAILTKQSDLSGVNLRALQLSLSYGLPAPECRAADKNTIAAYIAGTGSIDQFGDKVRGTYADKFKSAYDANNDTVGYIEVLGTNVSYPIMFDKTGKWYYNDHTPAKEKAESGSVYSYYYGQQHNDVITGHNSRPSGSMFHQLHHIEDFNMGKSNCEEKKYCGKELSNLPDLKVYSERVWDVYLYGEEARYEIFAMFETKAPADVEKSLKEYVWYPYGKTSHDKDTDEKVQAWIDDCVKQTKELSGLELNTNVNVKDDFLTVFTCATQHSDAGKGARLYFMLKKVDY